ncbi:MarR family winged helix-turn-helix transcriptional regulator [Humitalea sp. 24SJ18S-53]|uniref:MarR family winged helix-turn-helix transcriptional regulator n=1 Tax=Humitalea sp. 24SJ18S-53 TaxID=3422307 RepID=UPI003D674AB1
MIPLVHERPGHLIRRCQQIAVGLFLEHCAPFDLTPMQYAVLRAAEAQPGLDQITMAGLIGLDRSNAARLGAALEARGLLHRTTDPADRRVRLLRVTPAGAALLRAVEPAVERVQAELLAPVAPDLRPVLLEALGAIASAHNLSSRAPQRVKAA